MAVNTQFAMLQIANKFYLLHPSNNIGIFNSSIVVRMELKPCAVVLQFNTDEQTISVLTDRTNPNPGNTVQWKDAEMLISTLHFEMKVAQRAGVKFTVEDLQSTVFPHAIIEHELYGNCLYA